MNVEDGRHPILFLRKQHSRFQHFQVTGVDFQVTFNVAGDIFAFLAQFKQGIQVFRHAGHFGFLGNSIFQSLAVLHGLLAEFGAIPECRVANSGFGSG